MGFNMRCRDHARPVKLRIERLPPLVRAAVAGVCVAGTAVGR